MVNPIDDAIVRAIAVKFRRDGGQQTEDFLRTMTAAVAAGKLLAMYAPRPKGVVAAGSDDTWPGPSAEAMAAAAGT